LEFKNILILIDEFRCLDDKSKLKVLDLLTKSIEELISSKIKVIDGTLMGLIKLHLENSNQMYIRLPDNSTVELTYYKQLESRIK
jgi:hypothetical protein